MPTKKGSALIVQGGGARGTYAAGVLKVLLENDFSFDEVYGTSAGALLGVEYVTKDSERLGKLIEKGQTTSLNLGKSRPERNSSTETSHSGSDFETERPCR